MGNTIDDLSADCLPVPVCRFRFDDGTPVVQGTNQSFDDRLGAVEQDEPLAAVFERFETPEDWDQVLIALRNGKQLTVSPVDDDVEYLVDVTPPADSTEGFLLFTDVTDLSSDTAASSTDGADGCAGPFEEGLAVDHVASVVSHDLRNPLDVARARLRAGREFDEAEHFDHVEQAHDRMERIIQDVLTLARGEDVVDPDETVDLGALAEQAWETVETNGATLTVEDALPTALADADRVGRLFENLFRNSVEHGREDPSESVEVTVGSLDGSGFFVADDGPGIPKAHRERVLEPGYSADEHGTGLGLAIVARIADLHGWEVDVTDSREGGARFEISGVDQQ